jgi:general secretion pathway protein G
MRRRRSTGASIFLPWEKRGTRLAWLSRRHARAGLLAGVVLLAAWCLTQVVARRRAVYATRAAIGNVMRAVEAFRADHEGRCPTGVAQLLAPGDGREPYLARAPRDAWGRPLRVTCPGRKHPTSADVTSGGPDGNFDDRDQIE